MSEQTRPLPDRLGLSPRQLASATRRNLRDLNATIDDGLNGAADRGYLYPQDVQATMARLAEAATLTAQAIEKTRQWLGAGASPGTIDALTTAEAALGSAATALGTAADGGN